MTMRLPKSLLLSVLVLLLLGPLGYLAVRLGIKSRWMSSDMEELSEVCSSCESAKIKAEDDFRQDNVRLVEWGLPDSENKSQRAILFEERFRVKTVLGGCIVEERIECYNNRIVELLINRFGIDTLNKTMAEAAASKLQ